MSRDGAQFFHLNSRISIFSGDVPQLLQRFCPRDDAGRKEFWRDWHASPLEAKLKVLTAAWHCSKLKLRNRLLDHAKTMFRQYTVAGSVADTPAG